MEFGFRNSNCLKENKLLRDIAVQKFLNEFKPYFDSIMVFNGGYTDNRRVSNLLSISLPVFSSKLAQHRSEIKGYKFNDREKFEEFKNINTSNGLIKNRIVMYTFKLFNHEEVFRLLMIFSEKIRDKVFDMMKDKNKCISIAYLESSKRTFNINKRENNFLSTPRNIYDDLISFCKGDKIESLKNFTLNSLEELERELPLQYLIPVLKYCKFDDKKINKYIKYLIDNNNERNNIKLSTLTKNKNILFNKENLKVLEESNLFIASSIYNAEILKFI